MGASAKSILITQSNYIPWKGYFDSIQLADEMVILDSVQFTKRDWRNRNVVMTQQGLHWLTIPVRVKGKFFQSVDETVVSETGWAKKHWRTLEHVYRRAPFFGEIAAFLHPLYMALDSLERLTQINEKILREICDWMGIKTVFLRDRDFQMRDDKNLRILDICTAREAGVYLTGPAAKSYIDEELFRQHGIDIRYLDYSQYPPHPQWGPTFEHGVSVVDLLFHTGPRFREYLKHFSPAAPHEA